MATHFIPSSAITADNSLTFPAFLLLIGIFGAFIGGNIQFVDGYMGYPLQKKECTLVTAPEYTGGKNAHYSFRVNEILAELHIDNTAAELYSLNLQQLNIEWKAGDTVIVSTPVHTADLERKFIRSVDVYGLSYGNTQIIDPITVESMDRKRMKRWYTVSGIIFCVGLLTGIYRKLKSGNPHQQSNDT